jgi:hypothetical protein
MTDLRCRCMGIKKDDQCIRDADEEDGLCDTCRLGDGTCCEDYADESDAYLTIMAKRIIRAQKELEL